MLRIVEKSGKDLDKKAFVLEIMATYGVSNRTAKEYLSIAERRNGGIGLAKLANED